MKITAQDVDKVVLLSGGKIATVLRFDGRHAYLKAEFYGNSGAGVYYSKSGTPAWGPSQKEKEIFTCLRYLTREADPEYFL